MCKPRLQRVEMRFWVCKPRFQCFSLQVENSSESLLTTVVDDFQSDMKYVEQLYSIHCCKGLSLEILDALAIDLNFR